MTNTVPPCSERSILAPRYAVRGAAGHRLASVDRFSDPSPQECAVIQRRVGKPLRTSLILAGVVLAGGLAACSNGVEAGTLDPPSFTGVSHDAGDLHLRNAVIVAHDAGGVTVSLTIVNVGDSEDTLTDVTIVTGDEPVEATMRPRSVSLPPGSATVAPGESGPEIGADVDLAPGGYVSVSMQFEGAGLVEVSLPVVTENSQHSGGGDSTDEGADTDT